MEKISILGFLFVILCLITRDLACKGETLEGNCLKADREALLDFKNGLKDSSNNRLSSWIGGNCCQWEGIGCENNTGVVISIDLHNPYYLEEAYENWSSMNLSGEIRPSLIELKSLRSLDLSGNSFEHIPIPKFFGSLKNLQYLNLSNCGFRGAIPPTLGNLSNLQFLDLSSNESQFFVKDLEWLTNLVSLRHLKLNYVNLSMVGSHWMEVFNKLSFLTELHLEDCGLSGSISSLNSINFTSLSVISISGNSFRSKFPIWLLNLSSLVYIDVSFNQLYGQISPGLGELPNLQHLDLSGNKNLTGSCSQLLSGSWKKIEFLNLAINKFLGSFSEFLEEIKNCSSEGPLPELGYLDLSSNQLVGRLPERLSQLEKLTYLDLSGNKLQGPIPASFGTFKNLNEMRLGGNELNGSLPVSFGQISELVLLDVSGNRMIGILSEEHFSKLSKLKELWINGNSGLVLNVSSTWVPQFQITKLSMASCNLGPLFPTWLRSQKEVSLLDLSNASISGFIPKWFWNISFNLQDLSLSQNQLQGTIPESLSQLEKLTHLDLSCNKLQGPIPASFGTFKNLNEMQLGGNELNGSLPVSFGQLSELVLLDVSGNRMTGILSEEHFSKLRKLTELWINGNSGLVLNVSSTWVPQFQITKLSMASCNLGPLFPTWLRSQKEVSLLDLSNASISGFIPKWFWNISLNLQDLSLSQNQLQGTIPESLSQLEKLTHLDLSCNKLQGPIPASFGTFKNLNEMQLGGNELNGSLPVSFGQLSELVLLDVSGNRMTGILSEEHFSKLSKLTELWINGNSGLVLNVSSTWVPQFQITKLSMASCNLGPLFPTWLRSQKEVSLLDLSNASISGFIPKWFWNISLNLQDLSLSQNQLQGTIPEWLSHLEKLTFLDLSGNKLQGPIPASFGTFKNLNEMRLGGNELNGSLPVSFGQLSELVLLDVSGNRMTGILSEEHFSKLSKLTELWINGNSGLVLNVSSTWVPQFQITKLSMASCNLGPLFPTWLRSQKEVSLLDLSNASISGFIPKWFWNISLNLQDLSLSQNQLQGTIPEWLSHLEKLTFLDLSGNKLQGPIPASFGTFKNLREMWLGSNELNGSLPVSFGQLSELVKLDVSLNRMTGILSEEHFSKLSKLKELWINRNSGLVLNVSSTWVPPFQVTNLSMASCNLGPSFPNWLRTQKEVFFLDLSNASISGFIPKWFWNISFNLSYLKLSHNQLQGQLPNSLKFSTKGVYLLDFSYNKFSGPIPLSIGESMLDLNYLFLSKNQLTGTIPDSIGHITSLQVIDFSRNNLTGSIPYTINNCSSLIVLDLGNNHLSGTIPKSLGQLQWLESLHLNDNKLSGGLPSSFQNLSRLELLDLSYNQLLGKVPSWIGTTFINLVILNLRSNVFFGRLPPQLSNLSSLRVLDLAQNSLMGEIPITFVELKAMAQENNKNIYPLHGNGSNSWYEERLVVNMKGQSLVYTRTLFLVVSIDLSDNNLSGEFPQEITKLFGLLVLNLSRNHIIGQIPESISMLKQLLSLDLSNNKLSGTLPSSMASLTFLSYLNLSNNNFSGKIPFIGQMTTFTESGFVGNPNLCGAPLVTKCQDEDLDKKRSAIEDKNDGGYIDQWFYLSVGLGFAMGILIPYFVLATRKSWCEAYFDFVDKIVKWLLRGRATCAKDHLRR